MASISSFKTNMRGGGARPNQFLVGLSFPSFVQARLLNSQRAQFLCKASKLPASIIEPTPVIYRGTPVNFAGDRTYSPWNVTFYVDETFGLRDALEIWQNGINELGATDGRVNPEDYQVDLNVQQLNRNDNVIKTYTLYDSWVSNIGEIALDWESTNQIETFDVEFVYNYHKTEVIDSSDGFGVNVSVNTPVGTIPIIT